MRVCGSAASEQINLGMKRYIANPVVTWRARLTALFILLVLAGCGAVSFAETIDKLHGLAYQGYISFEWEKYWHPEIEEPELAFEDFATAMKLALRCETGKESQELPVGG